MGAILKTPRLELVPITVDVVVAVMADDRARAEEVLGATMPPRWPNRTLVEQAFTASLEAIRADPEVRLWGDRVMIERSSGAPRVVGSVVFHGFPAEDGIAEVAYGVDEGSQGQGYATEAVAASVAWAFSHDRVRAVQATTFDWHKASLRVISKLGMRKVGTREHELLGAMDVYEIRR